MRMKSRRREEGVDKILYITIHYDIAFIADKRAEEMVDRGSFSPHSKLNGLEYRLTESETSLYHKKRSLTSQYLHILWVI